MKAFSRQLKCRSATARIVTSDEPHAAADPDAPCLSCCIPPPPAGHPLQAVPGVWVRKAALITVLKGGTAGTVRIGGRRLGPYEVLAAKAGAFEYLLLRAATGEAAAGLPPTPSAAELTAAAAATAAAAVALPRVALQLHAADGAATGLPPAPAIAAGQSPVETAPSLLAIQQHDPVFGLSIVVVAALAALPPPGPGDATAAERQTLLATARPEGDLAARAVAPAAAGTWDWAPLQWEINSVCRTVRLLRVRQCPRCRTPADNSLKPSLSFCRRS